MRVRPHPLGIFALGFVLLATCRHVPTEKERQGALIHYDLGIQQQQSGDMQGAFKEFQTALDLDPGMPEAHNAIGLVLHLTFKHYDEAIQQFRLALEARQDLSQPGFGSEVKTNLGNVYLSQKRFDEAIKLYEEALNDMQYATPFIAQGNLGQALFEKGDQPQAIDHIKTALTLNPKFCLGYKNLGTIYEAQKANEEACKQFEKYKEHCPQVADAYYRLGVCLAKVGRPDEAKPNFADCQAKAVQDDPLKEDCRQLQEKLQ